MDKLNGAPPKAKRRRINNLVVDSGTSNPSDTLETDPELDLHHELTTCQGQLKKNPAMSLDEAQSEARREYLRRNAARTRLRSKRKVAALQEQHGTLSQRVKELSHENEILRAQLTVLLEQPVPVTATNRTLSTAQVHNYQPGVVLSSVANQHQGRNGGGSSSLGTTTQLGPQYKPLQNNNNNNNNSLGPWANLLHLNGSSSLEVLSLATQLVQATTDQARSNATGQG